MNIFTQFELFITFRTVYAFSHVKGISLDIALVEPDHAKSTSINGKRALVSKLATSITEVGSLNFYLINTLDFYDIN